MEKKENKEVFCSNCGNKLKEDEKFCSKCGNKVGSIEKTINKKSIGMKIFDIISYIIGGFLTFIFLIALIGNPDFSIFIALLWGVSIMPLIYNIVQKKYNISNKKIIIFRIMIPCIMFIVLMGAIIASPISEDSNSNNGNGTTKKLIMENQIAQKIDKNISSTYMYKNTEVKKVDDKYNAIIYLKRNDESYNEKVWMAIDGLSVINGVKNYHFDDVDKLISIYTIHFYDKSSNEIYSSTYENDNSPKIEQLILTSTNGENSTITKNQIDEYYKKQEEEKKKQEQAKVDQYKNSCAAYSYKDVLRNPNDYNGKQAYWLGEVNQVIGNGVYKVSVSCEKNSYAENGYLCYSDDVYVTYYGDLNLIEDDLIKMWGTMNGTQTYTTVLGASVTIPKFTAKYVELQ